MFLPHHPLFPRALILLRGKNVLEPVMRLLHELGQYSRNNPGRVNTGDVSELAVIHLLRTRGVSSSMRVSIVQNGVLQMLKPLTIPPNLDMIWVRSSSNDHKTVVNQCLGNKVPTINVMYLSETRTLYQIDCLIYLQARRKIFAVQITESQVNEHVDVAYTSDHLPLAWKSVMLQVLWIAKPFLSRLREKVRFLEG
jgi:hypothetical protein